MNYIYMISNINNGKFYIGSTTQYKKRFSRHKETLKLNTHHNKTLQEDYNTHGEEAFSYILLEELPCEESLRSREQDYLDMYYESGILYNISKHATCGDLLSYHPNKEDIVSRISATLLEKNSKMTEAERKELWGKNGEENGMYGRTHTEASRKKISENIKRFYENNESYRKGKTFEELFGEEEAIRLRKNLSDHAKNRTGNKNPFYGKTHTPETREKLSKIHTGRSNPSCWKAVSCEGVVYESISKAANHFNVCGGTIIHRIKSKNYPDYFYV
jgi:group I intron endonuclease